MEQKITYFEELTRENTAKTLELALERGKELGIDTFVVASTSGWTGVEAAKALAGQKVIVVSHSYGSREPDKWLMKEENLREMKEKGACVVTAAHAFGGITRAMNQMSIQAAPSTYVIGDIVANTLRMFGQGTKVVAECACMAADAGLVRCDTDIISIGGTGGGADTAVVLQPANSHRLFQMKIREIICKPRLK
ncbi:MAG: hypothetical protein JW712_04075 [Dehalococcoidales bacterium]|nr:hypothetical protein [Dehalococcoidales bacterium]